MPSLRRFTHGRPQARPEFSRPSRDAVVGVDPKGQAGFQARSTPPPLGRVELGHALEGRESQAMKGALTAIGGSPSTAPRMTDLRQVRGNLLPFRDCARAGGEAIIR